MAEDLTIRGVEVRRRNPWGVWALSLITLNIYGFVWWYKINREMRDVSAQTGTPLGNDPATSVWAIIFAGPITVGTTTQRLRLLQYHVFGSFEARSNIGLAVLLYLLGGYYVWSWFGFHTVYLQSALNRMYDTIGQST